MKSIRGRGIVIGFLRARIEAQARRVGWGRMLRIRGMWFFVVEVCCGGRMGGKGGGLGGEGEEGWEIRGGSGECTNDMC